MERKEILAFLGRPGVGKTRLAVSPAEARAESGGRIYSGTLSELFAALATGHLVGRLKHRPTTLIHPTLQVVDETGSL
ncbi:MAG: ATP-binding protein [Bryobacterales bacterium]|nr:ATP-binding protein [Bryobacterales bacterium]